MGNLSGCITATLADRDESYDQSLVDEINRRVNPPRPVTPAEVYVRAMYIVSDQVNSQGGRFADEELDRLAELLVDSPVMVGHRRDSLPVARNFKAVKLEADGRVWIKSYFYWMKDSVGAEDLRRNIDGGIYKECSISFLFTTPECSICGEDIRRCPHIPFHEYESEGRTEIAHFTYRDIVKVLETSLVFRGAVPDTHITDRLSSDDDTVNGMQAVPATHTFTISDIAGAGSEARSYGKSSLTFVPVESFIPDGLMGTIHVMPYQPGVMLRISRTDNEIIIETPILLTGKVRRFIEETARSAEKRYFVVDAILYASRGKDRRGGCAVMQVIEAETNLHRLKLRLCDVIGIDRESCLDESYEARCRLLKSLYPADMPPAVTIVRPERYTAREVQACRLKERCRKLNFGLEAICEGADGALSRHILSSCRLVPATVTAVTDHDRSHVAVGFHPVGNEGKIREAVCSRLAGLEKGAVALLREVPEQGNGDRNAWMLHDIIPGGESLRIQAPTESGSRDSARLFVDRDNHRLQLEFFDQERWLKAVVHHFSSALFARHRRFIADITDSVGNGAVRTWTQVLPVRHVIRTGKLIRIELAGTSRMFGDSIGLWFRPVLIDGAERHLFYAEGIIGHPGEL